MAIPLLEYAPSTQNARIEGYEIGGDEKPTIYTTEYPISYSDMGNLIEAAYRQIFFHAFKYDREVSLESLLRNGQITVRDFIRGLLTSETYITSFYEKNNNYRFVEQTVQRVLGRDVYSEKEKISWSIIVASKGYKGFFDALLESDEYLSNFGYDTVPYQRRRVLPGRDAGETPFNIKSPRYDGYYRGILGFPQLIWQNQVRRFVPQDKQAKAGDPSLYLSMARGISSAKGTVTTSVNTQIDYLSKVPKK